MQPGLLDELFGTVVRSDECSDHFPLLEPYSIDGGPVFLLHSDIGELAELLSSRTFQRAGETGYLVCIAAPGLGGVGQGTDDILPSVTGGPDDENSRSHDIVSSGQKM